MSPGTRGLWLGLVGVIAFSITLPATRVAVAAIDPVVVGIGRACVAAILAGAILALTRQPFPRIASIPRFLGVSVGVVFGFPGLTAWAMRHVPSAHGAVVVGILPLATALAGALLARERPSVQFWLWGLTGSAIVVGFALAEGGGSWHPADWALLGAVVAAAYGYAEGARLTREYGGWQVISWTLVFASPIALVAVVPRLDMSLLEAPLPAWLGFAYVALVSQYLGFFAWYQGLADGGIARVGQLQLLQPFLTLVAAALLIGESITALTAGAAALVVVAVALGRRAPVRVAAGTAAARPPVARPR